MTDYKSPYVLGLDVGTSSTRALLFDAQGNTIPNVISQQKYALTTSSAGEVSVDADTLANVVAATIKNVLHAAGPRAKEIGAVALDTFWHSLLGVNSDGRPVTPVITWEDTRAYDASLELRTQLDEKAVHERTGVRFHASYWPAKLRWLTQQQHDMVAQVAQWISFGEYLHRKFLDRSICSLSMASATGLLNRHTLHWDEELMQVLAVRAEQLPKLGDVRDSLKGLKPEYASAWPELREVPWFPAIGDGAAACVGSGCADKTNWSLTMGTSSAVRVVVPREDMVVVPLGLWQYLIDGKRSILGGALSEGGNLLNWISTTFDLPELKAAEPLASKIAPDSHGLTILPFISGERSLGWHAQARMTLSGLSIHTTPADVLRAGMESLAYEIYGVYEQLSAVLQMRNTDHKMLMSGGALLNSQLLQSIIADILGTSLYPSQDHEASARGAALLALEAMGTIEDIANVKPNLLDPTQPNTEVGITYRKAAARQRKLYQMLLIS
jgi:gluconokinase